MSNSGYQDDPKALMRLAKNGDDDAFGRLYQIYFTPVFRYIYLRTRNKEETEDLVQNVFIKVFKSIGSFQEKGVPPLAYFFTVARNIVIDHWRKKKDILAGDPEKILNRIPDPSESPHELSEKKDNEKMISRAIEELTGEQQEVIILKFINEFSNREIAVFLGKTEAAVRQLQCRALKNLRGYFKESKII